MHGGPTRTAGGRAGFIARRATRSDPWLVARTVVVVCVAGERVASGGGRARGRSMALVVVPPVVPTTSKASLVADARILMTTMRAHANGAPLVQLQAACSQCDFLFTGTPDHEQVVLFLLHQVGMLDAAMLKQLNVRAMPAARTTNAAARKRIGEGNRCALEQVMRMRVLELCDISDVRSAIELIELSDVPLPVRCAVARCCAAHMRPVTRLTASFSPAALSFLVGCDRHRVARNNGTPSATTRACCRSILV